jgi:hypothetical protein
MINTYKNLTIADLKNPKIITYYKNKFFKHLDISDNHDINNPNVFWYLIFDMLSTHVKLNYDDETTYERNARILKVFNIETLVSIYINASCHRSSGTIRTLEILDVSCEIIDSLMSMSHQWYKENRNNELIFELWKTFRNIKGTTAFNDERFKMYPIFTNSYLQGFDRSNWIRELEAGWINVFDESTQQKGLQRYKTSAYNTNYMDAKVGIVIYFKNLPSIIISFNCDGEDNLYIHQIQCKPKDRGHYKIKNWKESSFNLVKSIFPNFKVHLISGAGVVDAIKRGYEQSAANCQPDEETLQRVSESYDSMIPSLKMTTIKHDIVYQI